MNRLDERVVTRLEDLKSAGERLLTTSRDIYPKNVITSNRHSVQSQEAQQWGMSCLNLLERIFGTDSTFCLRFQAKFNRFPATSFVKEALGILCSAKDEIEHGMLFDTRQVVAAEIFDDFLEQAEHLLETDYQAPAAVIAGSVLEDGLRKLCVRHGIELPEKPKLDWMNAQLAKQGVYSGLVQKQITALAAIRNDASHGNWDGFTWQDVELMIKQVRTILATHFA